MRLTRLFPYLIILIVVPSSSHIRSACCPAGKWQARSLHASRWGLLTRYIGKLGDDPAAALHQQEFARAGVDTQIITAQGCASHQSFILVDPSGERTVIRRHDENLLLQPAELKREWISNARALLVDGCDTAAATTAANWAREAHIPVIADFDEAYPGIEELMKNVDYLIVSKDFPQMVCGEAELEISLPLLQRRFRCCLTAATLGSDGVLAWDGEKFHHASHFKFRSWTQPAPAIFFMQVLFMRFCKDGHCRDNWILPVPLPR